MSVSLRDKIEQARELLSHAIPSGDLTAIFERAPEGLDRARAETATWDGKVANRRACWLPLFRKYLRPIDRIPLVK